MFGLTSILGLFTGFKGMAIAGGIALLVGAVGGYQVRDAFCDAAAAKAALRQARADKAAAEQQSKIHAETVEDANKRAAAMEAEAEAADKRSEKYERELAKRARP